MVGHFSAIYDDCGTFTQLVVRFGELVLAHDPQANDLHIPIVAKWGKKGLVSLAFAISASSVYPSLKYSLGHDHGHGDACSRINVEQATLAPNRISE